MDAKLHKLLMMALRSDTNSNEAQAAFIAARRFSLDKDVDKLLDSGVATERVVYRTHNQNDYYNEFTLHIPSKFQFSMIERVFIDGVQLKVHVQMIKCEGQSGYSDKGALLVIGVSGTKNNVNKYSIMLDGYIDQINDSTSTKKTSTPPIKTKEKSFWSNLFKK